MTNSTKSINSIKAILKDEFTSPGFVREICYSLSRSLDDKNIYGIPAKISQTVSELRTLLEDEPQAPIGTSSLAEKKYDFIQSMEHKKGLYEEALEAWKALFYEITGSEFTYSRGKSNDAERRSKGASRQSMDSLLKKYG